MNDKKDMSAKNDKKVLLSVSVKTLYELKKVKEVFNELNASDDEIIGYALRLINGIHDIKLPGRFNDE
jgi:hypothetical protein